MSTGEAAERGRAEPIDVEFEPAGHHGRAHGIGWGTALALAVLAAGAGAAGGAIAPRFPAVDSILNKSVPDPAAAQRAHQTQLAQQQLSAIDTRLRSLETIMNTPLAQAVNGSASGADLGQRVFELQSGLRDVQNQLSQMPSSAQVAALVTQVQQLQQDIPAIAASAHQAEQASRAAYAVAAAGEASHSSGPFEEAYQSLEALLPQDENVLALAPLARTGAPTRAELRDRFASMDNDIIQAARQAQAGSGFWGRMQAELARWIIVRAPGSGDTPDGVVDQAEQRLAADDLQGAINDLNRLSGPPRQAANPWLVDAQRRLEIDTRLAAIRTELSRGT